MELQENVELKDVVDDENPLTQKRRGRKPKTKEVEEDIAPKKRGRRPKDKSFTVINTYKDDIPEIEDDNIILHLPANESINVENDDKIDTSGVLQYDPNLKEPAPYEPLNSMISDFALIIDKNNKLEEVQSDNDANECENIQKLDNDEVYVRDIGFEESSKNNFKILKKAKILMIVASDETKKEWDLSTDCCCFNCTERFETVPIGIPVRYYRGRFYCRDVFCSFNCAGRFIFMSHDIRGQSKKWEYYSLLCLMASKFNIEQNNGGDQANKYKIRLADDPRLLKKFGGPYTIEKYRENFYIVDTNNTLMYPPFASMYPQTEVAQYVNIHRQKAQMLNNDLKYNDYKQTLMDLRLRRDKPIIQKKNTLEEYMSLTIK